MVTSGNAGATRLEYCDSCNARTEHTVTVQIVTESQSAENKDYSREPYRITECQQCGETQSLRMNDA